MPVSGGTGEPVRLRVAHVTVEMAPVAKVSCPCSAAWCDALAVLLADDSADQSRHVRAGCVQCCERRQLGTWAFCSQVQCQLQCF